MGWLVEIDEATARKPFLRILLFDLQPFDTASPSYKVHLCDWGCISCMVARSCRWIIDRAASKSSKFSHFRQPAKLARDPRVKDASIVRRDSKRVRNTCMGFSAGS
jgi:hypothetical protein